MDSFSNPDGLYTLFMYDRKSGQLCWSDRNIAAKIIGTDPVYIPGTVNALKTLAKPGDHLEREAVLSGKTGNYTCQYRMYRGSRKLHWVEEYAGWAEREGSLHLLGMLRLIESQKQKERNLSRLACNDELTGLLNRVFMLRILDKKIRHMQKTGSRGAFLLAGVDDLGAINDAFGFDEADRVLAVIADRLSGELVRGSRIGRIAGSKFGIIIDRCNDRLLRDISMRMLNAVRGKIIYTRTGAVSASVSLGVISLPDQATTPNSTIARAEAALYDAKQHGKSGWSAFSEKTDKVNMRRRNSRMSDIILTALNERRIHLAFQPIVPDLAATATKYECLVRMQGNDGQEIPAPEFIPVAERLGLVHLLDRRVLELAMNTLSVCDDIHLNVNISMETVKDFVWAEGYITFLKANHDLAKRITVELTETQVIDAIDMSVEFVSAIKKLGCSFAIDDFGAGYTSFRNLQAMDIDVVKIDGSFVTGLSESRDNQLFIKTLLDLARNFKMQTVAEWVENKADALLLKSLGVDYLQGYFTGKPESFPRWLAERTKKTPPSGRHGAV